MYDTLCLLISESQKNSSFETILFNDSVEMMNYSLKCKGELKLMLLTCKQCHVCHNLDIEKR